MKRGFVRSIVSGACAATFVVAIGCGGAAQKSAAEPPSSPPAYGGAVGGYPQASTAQAPPSQTAPERQPKTESTSDATKKSDAREAPAPAPPPVAPGTAPSGSASRSAAIAARRDIEAAQRELEVAGSDCAAACRALGSMERATARLCVLEEASCEDVRVRLIRARQRVRGACGGCPNGPSVDPDAPIPSR